MGVSDPTILAFDTSAAHCAAAVLKTGAIQAERLEPMERGQAERLMPMLEEVLAEAETAWRDLDAIAVGVGPGSFTGVRIAVSAARGLALALGIPAVGVSNFEVMRGRHAGKSASAEIVSLPAPRGQAYVQHFRDGAPQSAPLVIDPSDPPADLKAPINMSIVGHRASEIGRPFENFAQDADLEEIARTIAQIAEAKLASGVKPERPVPLYVRPADAAPPREAAPVILP